MNEIEQYIYCYAPQGYRPFGYSGKPGTLRPKSLLSGNFGLVNFALLPTYDKFDLVSGAWLPNGNLLDSKASSWHAHYLFSNEIAKKLLQNPYQLFFNTTFLQNSDFTEQREFRTPLPSLTALPTIPNNLNQEALNEYIKANFTETFFRELIITKLLNRLTCVILPDETPFSRKDLTLGIMAKYYRVMAQLPFALLAFIFAEDERNLLNTELVFLDIEAVGFSHKKRFESVKKKPKFKGKISWLEPGMDYLSVAEPSPNDNYRAGYRENSTPEIDSLVTFLAFQMYHDLPLADDEIKMISDKFQRGIYEPQKAKVDPKPGAFDEEPTGPVRTKSK